MNSFFPRLTPTALADKTRELDPKNSISDTTVNRILRSRVKARPRYRKSIAAALWVLQAEMLLASLARESEEMTATRSERDARGGYRYGAWLKEQAREIDPELDLLRDLPLKVRLDETTVRRILNGESSPTAASRRELMNGLRALEHEARLAKEEGAPGPEGAQEYAEWLAARMERANVSRETLAGNTPGLTDEALMLILNAAYNPDRVTRENLVKALKRLERAARLAVLAQESGLALDLGPNGPQEYADWLAPQMNRFFPPLTSRDLAVKANTLDPDYKLRGHHVDRLLAGKYRPAHQTRQAIWEALRILEREAAWLTAMYQGLTGSGVDGTPRYAGWLRRRMNRFTPPLTEAALAAKTEQLNPALMVPETTIVQLLAGEADPAEATRVSIGTALWVLDREAGPEEVVPDGDPTDVGSGVPAQPGEPVPPGQGSGDHWIVDHEMSRELFAMGPDEWQAFLDGMRLPAEEDADASMTEGRPSSASAYAGAFGGTRDTGAEPMGQAVRIPSNDTAGLAARAAHLSSGEPVTSSTGTSAMAATGSSAAPEEYTATPQGSDARTEHKDAGPTDTARDATPTRVAFDDKPEIDPLQRQKIKDLAKQIVLSGLRDFGAGFDLGETTITGYGNGPRLAPSPYADKRAAEKGEKRADQIQEYLYWDITDRLNDHRDAVLALAALRGRRLSAEDFPIVTKSGGRDISAVGPIDGATGKQARRQAVITVSRKNPLAAAVDRLEELSPGFFSTPTDSESPEQRARRVLHLDDNPHVPDTPADPVRALLELVAEEMAAGRATSLASLSARYLSTQGLFSEETLLLLDDGTPATRNWAGERLQEVQTDVYYQSDFRLEEDDQFIPWERKGAAQPPFVVVTKSGDRKKVTLALPDGSRTWTLSHEEYVELLVLDEALGSRGDDVDVVIVSTEFGAGGLEMPREAAARLHKTLWAHSGQVGLSPVPYSGQHMIKVTDGAAAGLPTGGWIGSPPSLLGSRAGQRRPGEGVLRSETGKTIRDQQVSSYTVTDGGGFSVGRSSFNRKEQRKRERYIPDMIRAAEWYAFDPVTISSIGAAREVPWKGLNRPYFYYAHGLPDVTNVVEADTDEVFVQSDTQTGFLERRPSLEQLPLDSPVIYFSCYGSSPRALPAVHKLHVPFPPDPLDARSRAQRESTRTGRDVYAPNLQHIAYLDEDDAFVRHGVLSTPRNDEVSLELATPEPNDEELDSLIDLTSLETRPGSDRAATRKTMLRLVHALRHTFGADVGRDKGQPSGTYHQLLRGIVALEHMRRRDEILREYGELTLDLIDRVTRAHHGLATLPGTRPAPLDGADVRTMLRSALSRHTADRRTPLSRFVALPSVDRARELMIQNDADPWARQVLNLPPAVPVTARHRQLALWATVKAVEGLDSHPGREALTRKVLHLPPGPQPQGMDTELLRMSAAAAAVGIDTFDPTALAAYDLRRHGMLDDAFAITSQSGRKTGRSWTRKPVQNPLWEDRYFTSPTGDVIGSKTYLGFWNPEDDKADGPLGRVGAYVLDVDITDGQIDMPWPDGTVRQAPFDEVAELLYHDDDLADFRPDSPVVIVGDATRNANLAAAISARTGTARNTAMSEQPARIVDDPIAGASFLVMTLPKGEQPRWQTTSPPELTANAANSAPAGVANSASTGVARAGGRVTDHAPQAPSYPPEARERILAQVTEDDLPDSGLPALDPQQDIDLETLSTAGVRLDSSLQVQAVMRDNKLQAKQLTLTRIEHFRLLAAAPALAADPAAASAAVDTALAAAFARERNAARTQGTQPPSAVTAAHAATGGQPTDGATGRPSASLRALEEVLEEISTATAALRQAAGRPTAQSRSLMTRTLDDVRSGVAAQLPDNSTHSKLQDVLAALRAVDEVLLRLRDTWAESGEVTALLVQLEAAAARFEVALSDAAEQWDSPDNQGQYGSDEEPQ
ncbi:lonely Cys domain-containing protein [Streptomyces tendae]